MSGTRLWCKTFVDGQKQNETIVSVDVKKRTEIIGRDDMLTECLSEVAKSLDIERPVIVRKHMRDLYEFGRAVFLPSDFIEEVSFDKLVCEIIS